MSSPRTFFKRTFHRVHIVNSRTECQHRVLHINYFFAEFYDVVFR